MKSKDTESGGDAYEALRRRLGAMERLEFLFFWLRWFYPKARGVTWYVLLYCFLFQKVLRINGRVPWPVHFTSRILYPKNITVGDNSPVGLSGGGYVQARNGIIIGNNFRMGPGVGLISANHDLDDYDRWAPTAPITIGDNVWIGMNTVVLPGVRIGDNVVVASNSCVNRDIPPNSIAGGAPCQVIKEKGPYQGKSYDNV
ncbi:MAG: acyltransferase [Acidobacteriota bacterium]|nr:acyltransferase [Acidobacteriota bacterium]